MKSVAVVHVKIAVPASWFAGKVRSTGAPSEPPKVDVLDKSALTGGSALPKAFAAALKTDGWVAFEKTVRPPPVNW
jgi:hypothetical protein